MSKPGAATSGGKPSPDAMVLEYNKAALNKPSNISAVHQAWCNHFGTKYGQAGRFLETGVYREVKTPSRPAAMATLDKESDEFDMLKQGWKQQVIIAENTRAADLDKRTQIYTEMWSLCSEAAKAEVMMHAEYEALARDGDDPLKLWKLLVRTLSWVPGSSPDVVSANLIQSYYSYRQMPNVSLPEYKREVETRLSNLVDAGVPAIPPGIAAATFITGLDRSRYSGLQNNITSRVQEMPKTVSDAYSLASVWTINRADLASVKRETAMAATTAKNCDQKSAPPPTAAAPQGGSKREPSKCFHCGAEGHRKDKCPAAKLGAEAKAKWESKHTAAIAVEEPTADATETELGFCIDVNRGVGLISEDHRQQRITSLHKYEIAMDSCCTVMAWGEAKLLRDIRSCEPVPLTGVGGTISIAQIGTHPDFGDVYYLDGLPNLVSYGLVKKKAKEYKLRGDSSFRVEVDNDNDTFHVISNGRVYCFRENGRGLYTCDLSDDVEAAALKESSLDGNWGDQGYVAFSVQTVEANEKLYSKAQVAAAKRVLAYSNAMGAMSMANLISQVRSRRVDGMNFTVEDVTRAFEIYGPSLQAVRGKTVRLKKGRAPEPIADKIVDVRVTMHLDLMFLSGVAFLIGYVKPLGLLLCSYIKNKTVECLRGAISKQKGTLVSEGFEVVQITSDSESSIVSLQPELEAQGCRVSIHAPGTDSAEVDVKIKQIKNVTRSITVLPYLLPMTLLMYAVYYAVGKINMWPSSTLAHNYSPLEVFTGRSVSVERDLGGRRGEGPLAFGSRVEVFEKTTNTLSDRTRPALWLGSKSNAYASGRFFLLDSEKVVSRDQWKSLPMDMGTINLVNAIARRGPLLPKNLKMIFKGKEVADFEMLDDLEGNDVKPIVRRRITEEHPGTDGAIIDEEPSPSEDIWMPFNADDALPEMKDPLEQLLPEETTSATEPGRDLGATAPEPEKELGGAPPEATDPSMRISTSGDATRGLPSASPSRPSNRQIPEAPWHLAGDPIAQPAGGGRPKRATKAPERFMPESFFAGARHEAYNLSVERALKELGDKAAAAMMSELQSLQNKGVFEPVSYEALDIEQRKSVIRSSMFLKEKFLPNGDFDKLKARFVAGGHMQDRTTYSTAETSAPTASTTAVYAMMAICAAEGRHLMTMDVGSAYLNADMKRDVFMSIEPRLTELMCKVSSSYAQYVKGNGTLVVKLRKALYGCLESAKLWYEHLAATLRGLGFVVNEKEKCVFNKAHNGRQISVVVYVDDLACSSVELQDLEWLHKELLAKYEVVTCHTGPVHSYLGQTFDLSVRGQCGVTMSGYIKDILEHCGTAGTRATPASEDLFKENEGDPLLPKARMEEFHSRVAKLLYLSMRARPDILTAVSFLTTRVTKCTEADWVKLDRVLMYLNGCPTLGLVLRATEGIRVLAYVDASFATHADLRSHTGGMLSMGMAPVNVLSRKQDGPQNSSASCELVGLSDYLPMIIWFRDFLIAQGYKMGPAKIFEDNMAAIALATRGASNSSRTKHLAIRYFFIKDRMDSGEVELQHLGTKEMLADFFTKPLQGDLFRKMRAAIMGA